MTKDYSIEIQRIFRLFYPILMAQVAQSAMSMVDTVMAGQVSPRDLAAIAVATSFWLPIGLVVYGTLIALTPIIARLHGAKKEHEINFEMQQGAWIALPISLITMLILYHSTFFLQFVDIDAVLLEKTVGYLHAILWGIPGLAGYVLLRNLIEGMSETKPTMVISLLGLGLNIPINYLFIYGAGPIPAMGAIGCGIATAIVFWLMFAMAIAYIAYSKRYQHLDLCQVFYPPQWTPIKRILKLGLPIAFAICFEVSLFTVVGVLIAPLGPIIVAGHQVAFNISSMIFTVPLSLGMAITIRVGHSLGEGKTEQAQHATLTALLLATGTAIFSASCTLLFRESIADLYSNNRDVILFASHLLLFAAAYQIFDAVQVVAAHALRGYKDTQIILAITFTAYWLIGFPIGYTLSFTDWLTPAMGAQGFWIGFICGLTSSAILLLWRLRFIFQRYAQADALVAHT